MNNHCELGSYLNKMLTMGAKLTLFAKILYKPSLNVTYNESTYT